MEKSDNKERKILYLVIVVLVLVLSVMLVFLIKKIMNNTNDPKEEPKTEEVVFSYTPIMYKICDDDNCNYLLGSMHMGDRRILKFNQVVFDAYNEMDEYAAELDIQEIARISVLDYIKGEPFDETASDELKGKVKTFFEEHNISYEDVASFPIGYVYITITQHSYKDAGWDTSGADTYFGLQSLSDNKPSHAFETIEFQANLLANYTEEFYVNVINELIDSYDEYIQTLKDVYKYYLAADIDNLYKSLQDDTASELEEEFNKELIDNRNITMAEKIEEFLEQDKNVFIVVGAGHVIGEGGIIDLLSNKDYQISLVK